MNLFKSEDLFVFIALRWWTPWTAVYSQLLVRSSTPWGLSCGMPLTKKLACKDVTFTGKSKEKKKLEQIAELGRRPTSWKMRKALEILVLACVLFVQLQYIFLNNYHFFSLCLPASAQLQPWSGLRPLWRGRQSLVFQLLLLQQEAEAHCILHLPLSEVCHT